MLDLKVKETQLFGCLGTLMLGNAQYSIHVSSLLVLYLTGHGHRLVSINCGMDTLCIVQRLFNRKFIGSGAHCTNKVKQLLVSVQIGKRFSHFYGTCRISSTDPSELHSLDVSTTVQSQENSEMQHQHF